MERKKSEVVAMPPDLSISCKQQQQQQSSQVVKVDHKFTASSSSKVKLPKPENLKQSFESKCGRHELCQSTVVIRNISVNMTVSQLCEHFAKFGKICNAKFLYNCKPKKGVRQAEIQYIDASAALDVVTSPKDKHFHSGRFMKPSFGRCEKWECSTYEPNFGFKYESEPQCHFDNLAEELIHYIISYLNCQQKIGVERVCKRWQSAANVTLRKTLELDLCCLWDVKYSTSTEKPLTNEVLISILKRCGTSLLKIKIFFPGTTLTKNFPIDISKHCPNLESADLSYTGVASEAIKILVEECKNLHTLKLKSCIGFCEQGLCWVLTKGKNIKYIDVSGNPFISGKCFHLVNDSLETLIFNGCRVQPSNFLHLQCSRIRHLGVNFTPLLDLETILTVLTSLKSTLTKLEIPESRWSPTEDETGAFVDILRNCQNLQFLNLQCNAYLNYHVINQISSTCLQLRHLDLSGNRLSEDNILSLRKLPHLRSLYLNNVTEISNNILTELSLPGKLEHVKVQKCPLIGDTGCLALIKNCPGLKLLDVSDCVNVTDSIVRQAQALKHPGSVKLQIIACGSGIRNTVRDKKVWVSLLKTYTWL